MTISFPGSGPDAAIHIYDRQGRKVKSFTGVGGNAVEWDAAGMGNGVYLVKVFAGNREILPEVFHP